MFTLLRQARPSRGLTRAFSVTPSRSSDVAKLILVGRLGKDPEVRITKNDKEFVSYTVATTNFPPPLRGPDGVRPPSKTTWHHIQSFNPNANNFLRHLQKGSVVFVEANFEVREPDPLADPSSNWGQRQILLRHESIRVLRGPVHTNDDAEHIEEYSEETP